MKWTAVLVSLSVLALAASASFGATITVPGDHATIGEAVAAASDGDVINVSPGPYTENVLVDKAVTIRGVQGPDVTTVTAASTGHADSVFRVTSSDVTISGFTISSSTGRWGTGVSIEGLVYYDAESEQWITVHISDVTVSKCVIENNIVGVLSVLADDCMIVNNTIRSNTYYSGDPIPLPYPSATGGVMVCQCHREEATTLGTRIVNNEIYQNDGPGVVFSGTATAWDVTGTKIFGNNFYQNGNSNEWCLLWASDICMTPAEGSIKVSGNKFLERILEWQGQPWPVHGFYAWDSPDAKVVGNPEREELGPNIPMPTP